MDASGGSRSSLPAASPGRAVQNGTFSASERDPSGHGEPGQAKDKAQSGAGPERRQDRPLDFEEQDRGDDGDDDGNGADRAQVGQLYAQRTGGGDAGLAEQGQSPAATYAAPWSPTQTSWRFSPVCHCPGLRGLPCQLGTHAEPPGGGLQRWEHQLAGHAGGTPAVPFGEPEGRV